MRRSHPFMIIVALLLTICVSTALVSCNRPQPLEHPSGMRDPTGEISGTQTENGNTPTQATADGYPALDTGYSSFDLDATETVKGQTEIVLADDQTTVTGSGASYAKGVLTIHEAGTYVLSGVLTDGRVIVAAGEDDKVRLVLNGIDIACSTNAPMVFTSADKVALILASCTDNSVRDARPAVTDDASEEELDAIEYKAAITSAVSLTINGTGELSVTGGCRNGISTKKNLRVVSGVLSVTAQNVGLKGNHSVSVCGGNITVTSIGDCIKTEEVDNTAKGFVDITGGNLTLMSEGDGISASQYFWMSGGEVRVTTTGTVSASGSNPDFFGGGIGGFGGWRGGLNENVEDETTVSSKGVKADTALYISGGELTINSTGHCLHSAGTALVSGNAVMTLHSESGKGIATHKDLQIDGGTINVTYSYEGLESKSAMTINGGDITVYATDDGLNTGGTDEAGCTITINGGTISVNAEGDGIDANGDIIFNGGTVIVAGPQNSGNGPLDCGDRSSIYIHGGTLVAYGGMFQAGADNPDASSTQCTLRVGLSARAGTLVSLADSTGKVLYEITLQKAATNIYISLPSMASGETYTVSSDGSSTVTLTMDGIFATNLSGASGGMGGMMPGGKGDGGMRPGGRW